MPALAAVLTAIIINFVWRAIQSFLEFLPFSTVELTAYNCS